MYSHCNEDEWLDQTLASLSGGNSNSQVGYQQFSSPEGQQWPNFNSDSFYAPTKAYQPKSVASVPSYGVSSYGFPGGDNSVRAPSQREDYFAFKCFSAPPEPKQPPTQTYYTMEYSNPHKKYSQPMVPNPGAPLQQSYYPPQAPPQYQRALSTYEQQPQPSYFAGNNNLTQFAQCNTTSILDQFAFSDSLGPVKEITKKKPTKADPKSVTRRVRPKVVESKGAIQCAGTNLKKGTQCKNAALMEFIGPRPIYCAEHIELDPNTIYCKCSSPYGKTPGDGKGCKEIVLKEFGVCYKHFELYLASIPEDNAHEVATKNLERVQDLLSKLEIEAASAKKKRHDLFHRKNKLIPKFAKMATQLNEFLSRATVPTVPTPAPKSNNVAEPFSFDLNPSTSLMTAESVSLLDEEWKNLFSEEDAFTISSEQL